MKRCFLIFLLLVVAFWTDGYRFAANAEARLIEDEKNAPELILQTGHSKVVTAIVFSPDDRWLATASFDNTIRIWDVGTGRELRSLTGHAGAVKALAWSADGRWLASGGNDKTVRIWDVASGKEFAKYDDPDGTVSAIAFSGDGKWIAYGGPANSIIIRNVESGQELARLSGHTASISSLSFSADQRLLASGSADQTLRIWDTIKNKLRSTLKGHSDRIDIIRFGENGGVLASGGMDKTVRLWNAATGGKMAVLSGNPGKIVALNFLPQGKLMSAESDRTVKIWETTRKGALISNVKPTADNFRGEAESAAFSTNSSLAAIGSGDGTVVVSNTKTGKTLTTLETHTVGSYGVNFSPDRHWLASASFDNTVKLWDLRTGRSMAPLPGHTGRVTSVVFHPDNKRVISASVDKTLKIWNIVSGGPPETLSGHTGSIGSLTVGSSGNLIVSASSDQTIGLWDPAGKIGPRFLTGHTGEVTSVAISPDETTIVSSGMDGTVRLWDVRSGTPIRMIEPKAGEIDAVAFSSDGKLIAAGGVDRIVRVWESSTGRLLQSLPGHQARINSVSFSPDGRSISSASQDKTVRIWNVSKPDAVRVLSGHAGTVFSAAYSGDGRYLSSASDDGTVIIWGAENGDRRAILISIKDNNDWLVVTPEGFFDGSPSSWQQLSWRFDKKSFDVRPVEVFFNEFYSPGLLSDIIDGRKLPQDLNISSKDRRQPQLKLSLLEGESGQIVKGRNIRVNISVSNAPAGAEDVRLFRNGALVKVWRGDVLKGRDAVDLETMLPIIAGENRLTAYAFNRDDIKSSDTTLFVEGAERRKGVEYFLAVGVNEYANPKYNLTFAVADAQGFVEEMRRQQAKLNIYSRVEVVLLKDADATKANILKALSDLSAKIQPEDALIIYFAGHGTAQQNRFYLIPSDLGYTGSRTKLDNDGLQNILAHSISDQELQSSVEDIDAGQLLLVIDACNSGQALEAEEKRLGPMNSKGLAHLAYEKGMYILTAAQSYQAAKEATRLGHGFLTYALVEEGLKTNAADREPKDGQILLREWLDFAIARVPQIQEDDLRMRELEREKAKTPAKTIEADIQRPRVFYRPETEFSPMVIARP